MLNYGWICPKCGRVYAPSQEMCLYCGRDNAKGGELSWDKIKDYFNTTTIATTTSGATKEGENYATNRQGN